MVIVYYVFGPGNKVGRFITFHNKPNWTLSYLSTHPSTHPPNYSSICPSNHPPIHPSNLPVVHQLLVLSHFSPQLPFYCIIRCYTLLLHHHPFPLRSGLLSCTRSCQGQLLSFMHTTCPHHFSILFFIPSKKFVCYSHIFSYYFIS
jgi:hypothetical protein